MNQSLPKQIWYGWPPTLIKTIRTMKMATFLMFAAYMQVSAKAYSQGSRLTLSLHQVTLEKVFSVVKRQSDYVFLYNDEKLDKVGKKITLQVKDATIKEVMDACLEGLPLAYKIIDETIIITPKASLLPPKASSEIPPSDPISGTVSDSTGKPLIGVTVKIKGNNHGTVTDMDGHFELEVPENAILVFSYIGYEEQEVPIGERSNLAITMHSSSSGLNEVVVVGYGTVKKRDLTGAVSSVNAEKIAAVPVNNAAQALQGRVAGVVVTNTNWSPGQEPSVRIRGNRSINASNAPLYVVDGIPITGGLTEISPNDIESMEVLKDASATAIYGSRGANGVVLISTKKGKIGKTQVEYSGYYGFQTVQNELDLMNGGEYAEYVREAYRNTTKTAQKYNSDVPSKTEDQNNPRFKQNPYVMESVLMGYDEDGNYDPNKVRSNSWYDLVKRTGTINNHQLNIRGGSEHTQFLISGTYNKNNGIFKDEDYDRYSVRVNIDQQVNGFIKIGGQTQFSHVLYNRGSGMAGNWRVMPLGSIYEDDGSLTHAIGGDTQMWNPLLNLQPGAVVTPLKRNRYLGSYYIELQLPVDGLRFRSNLGLDYRGTQDYDFHSAKTTSRQFGSSYAKNATENNFMYTVQNLLYYDKIIHRDHSINVTLLQEIQENKNEKNSTAVEDLPGDELLYYDLGSGLKVNSYSSGLSQWNLASFMGRLNYGYKGRYLLTASLRYDGSSSLAPGNKWNAFPSIALAWRLSEEKFMKDQAFVDNLKVRLGFGRTGNSSVNPYSTRGSLSRIAYVYNNGAQEVFGYLPNVMPNPTLGWESTAQWNAGIDFGVLKNRISGTIDVYLQNTTNLLMPFYVPPTSGFDNVQTNIGSTRNKGFEVGITTANIEKKDFRWTTDWMFAYNHEEIVELNDGKVDIPGSGLFIGYPTSVNYALKKTGIWQNTPEDLAEMAKFNANGSNFVPGTIKIYDKNGDYKISEDEDRVILGSSRPKFTFSLENNLSYRNIDLSVFVYGSYGAMLYNNVNYLEQPGRNNTIKQNFWSPTNPSNEAPRPSIDFERPAYQTTMYYSKADFLRVRTITLGYSFPEQLIKKLTLNKLRAYLTAENPLIWTNFEGIDPEGAVGNTTPSLSSWIVGVNLSF